MFTIIFSLFSSIRQGFRTRAAPHTEILALRHQLLVLQRSMRDLLEADFWGASLSPDEIARPNEKADPNAEAALANSAARINSRRLIGEDGEGGSAAGSVAS